MFQKNVSLKAYNTFGIDINAENFVSVTSFQQLQNIISKHKDVFILSGGSNILLTNTITKPVIQLNTKGIEILNNKSENNTVFVKVQAGENWHDFVLWCLEKDFGGIENLSLIPGNVGTSPMQNIGAYGIEIKDVFVELEALNIKTNALKTFSKKACNFGYRESFFKKEGKGEYIIVSVTFKLTQKNHRLNTEYGAIQTELENHKIDNPTIKDISNAVIAIRQSKLPDPKEIGNSGSFFKNPVIKRNYFENLKIIYPKIPYYLLPDDLVKIPAGWLIEECGFKGERYGNAGVHKNQALVLVNYGNATGEEILDLAKNIQNTVMEKFNIPIEMEVNII